MGIYVFNTSFKKSINMRLNPIYSHMYILGNEGHYLPLPLKTVLKYRKSYKSAVYVTKSEFNKIVELCKTISDNGTFIETQDERGVILLFKYNKNNFRIAVKNGGSLIMIVVDIIE